MQFIQTHAALTEVSLQMPGILHAITEEDFKKFYRSLMNALYIRSVNVSVKGFVLNLGFKIHCLQKAAFLEWFREKSARIYGCGVLLNGLSVELIVDGFREIDLTGVFTNGPILQFGDIVM